MRFNFLKLSAVALVLLALATLGMGRASLAAQATAAPTTSATAVATTAPTTVAATSAATTAPTLAATTATTAATTAATSAATTAGTAAAPGAVRYAPCPDKNNATLAATVAATTAATTSATGAATTAPTAIPSSTPLPTATTNPAAGYLGIAAEQVQQCGARVLEVRPGTAAEKVGLQVGDVIVAVEGKPITGLEQLRDAVRTHKAGDSIRLTYERGTEQKDVTAVLGSIPPDTTATLSATSAATARSTAAATSAAAGAATTAATASK